MRRRRRRRPRLQILGRQAARQSEQDGRPRRCRSGRRPLSRTRRPGKRRTAAPGQTAAPDQAAKSDKSAKSAKAAKPDTLEKAGDKAILGLTDSPVPGLAIGAYGEMLFGAAQNPAAGGQWQGGADIRRMVLLPTYAITDNIIFNAELEWEHGGFLRWGRQGERRNRRRAIVDRFQDRRSVQLAGAGNRPRSDRLHQPASRADAVLQRAAAGNIQRPHPFDLDGPVEQRLRLDRRRTGLSDHGVEQHRGFRRRLSARARMPIPCLRFRPAIPPASPASMRSALRGRPSAIFGSSATRSRSRAGSTTRRRQFQEFAGSTSAYFTPNTTPRGAYADDWHAAGPVQA